MSGIGHSDDEDNGFGDLPHAPEHDGIAELAEGPGNDPDNSSVYAASDSGAYGPSEADETESCEAYSRHRYKVIVIGDANSGKTSFIKRYVSGEYAEDVATTIGVDYGIKTITNPKRQMVIVLEIWDIAGQDRNRTMVRPFFNDAVGAIVMADCTKMGQGFESAWKQDLDSKVTLPDGSMLPAVLVLNKCDLLSDAEFEALSEHGEAIMHQQGYCAFTIASAKDNYNVEEAFLVLVQQIFAAHEHMARQPVSPVPDHRNQLTVGEFVALKQRGYVPEREPQQCGC